MGLKSALVQKFSKKPASKPAPKPMSNDAKQIKQRQEYEKMLEGNVRRGGKK